MQLVYIILNIFLLEGVLVGSLKLKLKLRWELMIFQIGYRRVVDFLKRMLKLIGFLKEGRK